jgi:hypothetical protein
MLNICSYVEHSVCSACHVTEGLLRLLALQPQACNMPPQCCFSMCVPFTTLYANHTSALLTTRQQGSAACMSHKLARSLHAKGGMGTAPCTTQVMVH